MQTNLTLADVLPFADTTVFTERARQVMVNAYVSAGQMGAPAIHSGHVAIGIIEEADGLGSQVLTALGVDLDQLKDDVASQHGTHGRVTRPEWSNYALKIIEGAADAAHNEGATFAGTEHLALALTRLHACDGARMLSAFGAHEGAVSEEIARRMQADMPHSQHDRLATRAEALLGPLVDGSSEARNVLDELITAATARR